MKNLFITSLLLVLSTFSYAESKAVGTVILSFGQNTATMGQGEARALKRKSAIYADDLLKTSDKGRLQIRFTDGSRLSLKPNTEFQITEYQFDGSQPEDGKAIYKLLKGGMRTITGQIGKVDKEDYKLDAVVATIGIRGTDFTVERQGDTVEGSVNSGKINVTSNVSGESRDINSGRSFSIENNGRISERKTPASAESSSSSNEESDESQETQEEQQDESQDQQSSDQAQTTESDSGSDTSDDSSVSVSTSTTATGNSTSSNTVIAADTNSEGSQATVLAAPNPTGNGSAAPAGATVGIAFSEDDAAKGIRGSNGSVFVDDSSALTIDNGALTGILYVDPNPNSSTSDNPCAPCTFTSPSTFTQLNDQNSTTAIAGTTVSWGRWSSGYEVVENGTAQNPIGSFHFMYADSVTPDSVKANKTGEILYTFNGSSTAFTKPESENGADGALTGFTGTNLSTYQGTYLIVNWDDQTIDRVRIKGFTGSGESRETSR